MASPFLEAKVHLWFQVWQPEDVYFLAYRTLYIEILIFNLRAPEHLLSLHRL